MRLMIMTALAVGLLLGTSAGVARAENTCCQRDGSCANFIVSESGSFTEEDCIGEVVPSGGGIEGRQGYAVEGSCNTTTGHCEQVPLNGYCVAEDSCQAGLDCQAQGADTDLVATDFCWPPNNLQDIVEMQGGPGILVPSCRCVEPPPGGNLVELVQAVLLLILGIL